MYHGSRMYNYNTKLGLISSWIRLSIQVSQVLRTLNTMPHSASSHCHFRFTNLHMYFLITCWTLLVHLFLDYMLDITGSSFFDYMLDTTGSSWVGHAFVVSSCSPSFSQVILHPLFKLSLCVIPLCLQHLLAGWLHMSVWEWCGPCNMAGLFSGPPMRSYDNGVFYTLHLFLQ